MRHDNHEYAARILPLTYTKLGHNFGSDDNVEHVRRGTIYSQHRIDGNGGPLVTEIEGTREAPHSQQQRHRMICLVSIWCARSSRSGDLPKETTAPDTTVRVLVHGVNIGEDLPAVTAAERSYGTWQTEILQVVLQPLWPPRRSIPLA